MKSKQAKHNGKYKNHSAGSRVETVDMLIKKQKIPPAGGIDPIKIETGGIVPAIVSEKLRKQANAVLWRRNAIVNLLLFFNGLLIFAAGNSHLYFPRQRS